MRRKFFKLALIALLIAEIPIQGLKVMGKGHLLGQDQLNGQGLPNIIVIWELAAIYFLITFRVWRQENRMGRIAGNLVDALKAGIDFRRNETDESLRDRFASLVQRAALTYRNVFRYSEGTSFFKAQVRRKARSCSAHIMTLVPGIVTAGAQEIDQINEDLARLIIRSQTGYWHQTGDIAKHGAALTRPNTIRLGFLGFIKDRAVQIASLTLVAALLSAALAALLPLLLKHS
jgi:hypothetical protein